MRADIVPAAVLPDYELTDHAAKRRRLSNLHGPDPMIVVLSRGAFCSKNRRQAVGYCHLVTISTDNLLATNEYTDAVNNPMIPPTILRQDLRAVSKKCRPDWDITSPELRTQGETDRFYPYGKSYATVFGEQN